MNTALKPLATLDYYSRNAADYAERTFALDMSVIRDLFVSRLKPGGAILEAGCGAGRDVAKFVKAGFTVTAFDGCKELTEIAAQHTGQDIHHLKFEDLGPLSQPEWLGRFDGVWACASLLHLPDTELNDAISTLTEFLAPDGLLYMCFKYGDHPRVDEQGRFFNDFRLGRLFSLPSMAKLDLVNGWTSGSVLVPGMRFLNVMVKKFPN